MDESANSNTDYNEELVRDSLESPIEGNNDILISTVRNAVTESLKTCEGHGCVSLSNNLAWSTMDREKKSMNDKIDRKKGNSVRPREKNMIELNKETIRKGQRKNSYWEMHQKKLGRKAPIKSEGQNEASQTSDLRNSNAAAVELHEQLVLDEILTENDRLNSFSGRKNTMFHLNNCGKEETKKFDNLTAFEKDEYKLESTRSSETNISQLGKLHYERVIGYEHQLWLPTSRNFSTVQSAPADMQPCQNPFGQGYIDFNSMTSLTSMRSDSELVNSNMTYNGIYANAKRNSRANYKPYTLSDYKKLKSESKPGGLGPDTKSEEHQQKVCIVIHYIVIRLCSSGFIWVDTRLLSAQLGGVYLCSHTN